MMSLVELRSFYLHKTMVLFTIPLQLIDTYGTNSENRIILHYITGWISGSFSLTKNILFG